MSQSVCPQEPTEGMEGGCPFSDSHEPTHPGFDLDTTGYYHHLQNRADENGLVRWPEGNGWIAASYEATHEVLLHPNLSPSFAYHPMFGELVDPDSDDLFFRILASSVFGADMSNYGRLRQAVSRSFTKMAVGRFDAVAAGLIDGDFNVTFASMGASSGSRITFDWAATVASVAPYQIIARILGVPDERFDEYLPLARTVAGVVDPSLTTESFDALYKSVLAFYELGTELLDLAHADPISHPGVFAQLADMRASGHLTHEECVGIAIALLMGGIESSVNMLNNLMVTLATRPGYQDKIRFGGAGFVQKFVAEMFRMTPVAKQSAARYATEDLVLRGQDIKKGEAVVAMGGSANVDPSTFPEPREFEPDRGDLHKSLIFGKGLFRCVGAQVAEMEAQVAATRIVERLRDIDLEDVTWTNNPMFHNASSVMVSATVI